MDVAHEEYALSKINDKTAFRNEINGRLIKQTTEGNPSVIHVGPVVRTPGEMIHSQLLYRFIQVKIYHFIDNTILLIYVDDVPIRRCGGFAGIQCPSGYECIWKDPNGHETCNSPSPDASGVCRKGMTIEVIK